MKASIFLSLLFIPFLSFSQDLEIFFQAKLDSTYKQHLDAVGVLLHIESPDNNLSWTTAVGYSDSLSQIKLLNEQPILIASNTKPYVAAAVLRLVEMQKFKLDTPIRKLLHRKISNALKKTHMI